ncbi:MAG: LuxR C-terminal-related transcriptional regulator [Pseudomonadota bacterium]
MSGDRIILVVLGLQVVCATVVLSDIAASVLGLRSVPIAWEVREMIEIGAALGLVTGAGMGVVALRRSDARRRRVEDQLRAASGAFAELLERRFKEWKLTPAERDVALFAVKGMTLTEIANLRGTSEGTIKAQSAAVYRKAGVASRAQLVSHFVEELMGEALMPRQGGATPDRG